MTKCPCLKSLQDGHFWTAEICVDAVLVLYSNSVVQVNNWLSKNPVAKSNPTLDSISEEKKSGSVLQASDQVSFNNNDDNNNTNNNNSNNASPANSSFKEAQRQLITLSPISKPSMTKSSLSTNEKLLKSALMDGIETEIIDCCSELRFTQNPACVGDITKIQLIQHLLRPKMDANHRKRCEIVLAAFISLDSNDSKVAKWIKPVKEKGKEEIQHFLREFKKDEFILQLEDAFNQC